MDPLKQLIIETEDKSAETVNDRVEVVGLTIASCLNRAAEFLRQDLSMLDYEILEKGKKAFFNQKPYRLLVSLMDTSARFADLEEFSMKIGAGDRLLSEDLDQYVEDPNKDGHVLVRNYRTGVFMTVYPPRGKGKPADLDTAYMRLRQAGIDHHHQNLVEKAVKEQKGEAIRIADYRPRIENDSTCKVEVSPDEMRAYVRITPPKPGGRHLEIADVITALKAHGVVIGFMEDVIKKALEEDKYMQDIVAAQGIPPKHGADARIEYKVNIGQDRMKFEEDSSGRVDFKKMNLVENVVVGQVLAEKIPAEQGVPGRTLTNRVVEARDGRDVELRQGRNTILSEDHMRLIAEINGQVVYSQNKVSVDPVYRVAGDVGPKTGNIMFLGSVIIGGNVLDNFEVKAAGNVEVHGTVQKARIEAEGDIIVGQGVLGRDEAHIESTGGSIIAKFIQNTKVIAAQDVIVQESIMHSHVEAGNRVFCNGRRAQIVGGEIRAKKDVRAKMIGSAAYTATSIIVGVDPRILSQYEELSEALKKAEAESTKTQKSLATLQARQKADPDGFGEEQMASMMEAESKVTELKSQVDELRGETTKLEQYMEEVGAEGKVHIEKEIFPGVSVTIRDASQSISDTYRAISLSYDNAYVKIGKLEKREEEDQIKTSRRRR